MKKYRVLILDMDGTFVDSFPAGFGCCLGVARANGWLIDEATTEIIKDNWGSPTDIIVDKCWPGANYRLLQKALNDSSRVIPPPPLFPGASETLRLLKYRVDMCLNTGRRRDGAMPVLAHYGLMDCFARVVTKTDVRVTKPHPESLERLIVPYEKGLGFGRDAFLFVGDNPFADGECAKAAGIDYLAVAESSNVTRRLLAKYEVPDSMIIDRFRDLPDWLECR